MLVSIRLVSQLSEFAFFGASASVGALFVLFFLQELQNLLQKQTNCGIINMLHKFNIMRNGIFLVIGITIPFFRIYIVNLIKMQIPFYVGMWVFRYSVLHKFV